MGILRLKGRTGEKKRRDGSFGGRGFEDPRIWMSRRGGATTFSVGANRWPAEKASTGSPAELIFGIYRGELPFAAACLAIGA